MAAALVEALRGLETEGGPSARLERYRRNFETLAKGMTELGFRLFLAAAVQAPIIATFHQPKDSWFDFGLFYRMLAERGFLIYPGKLSHADTFRIGCIGALEVDDFTRLLTAIGAIKTALQNGGKQPVAGEI